MPDLAYVQSADDAEEEVLGVHGGVFLSLRSDGGRVDAGEALEASVEVLAQAFLLAAFLFCMAAHLASSCFDSCLDCAGTFHGLIAGGLGPAVSCRFCPASGIMVTMSRAETR